MLNLRDIIFLIIMTIYSHQLLSQKKEPQLWSQYYLNHDIDEGIGLKADVGIRNFDHGRSWNLLPLRAGALFNTCSKAEVNPAISFIRNSSSQINEYRAHLAFVYKNKLGQRFNWATQIRMETRSFDSFSENNESNTFKLRTRLRAQATAPINHSTLESKTLFGSLVEELLLHVAGDIEGEHIDQNRLVPGIEYYFTNNINAPLSYNYQVSQRNNSTQETGIIWPTIKQKL